MYDAGFGSAAAPLPAAKMQVESMSATLFMACPCGGWRSRSGKRATAPGGTPQMGDISLGECKVNSADQSSRTSQVATNGRRAMAKQVRGVTRSGDEGDNTF